MSLSIMSEHFELSPELRAQLERKLKKIFELAPKVTHLKLFLKRENKNQFEAKILVHFNHRDIICEERGPNLVTVVLNARTRLLRQLTSQKKRRASRRKSPLSAAG